MLVTSVPRAVVLLSGGLDSATCLAIAKHDGFEVACLTIAYGQRHAIEVESAQRIAGSFGVADHRTVALDLRAIGGSALTAGVDVPKHASVAELSPDVPVTYVPARNTIFLSIALSLAEVLGARDIYIGANAVDYSGYPDCRPEFLASFESLARIATRAGVDGAPFRVHAPLLELTKGQIINLGTELGVAFALTHSCYDPLPDGACGHCDSCLLRMKGFAEAGTTDPIAYARR